MLNEWVSEPIATLQTRWQSPRQASTHPGQAEDLQPRPSLWGLLVLWVKEGHQGLRLPGDSASSPVVNSTWWGGSPSSVDCPPVCMSCHLILAVPPPRGAGGQTHPLCLPKLRHRGVRSSVQGFKLSYRQDLHPEPFPPARPPTAQGEGRSRTESGSDDGHCGFQHRFWGRQTRFLSLVALRPAGRVWKNKLTC